MRKVGGGGGIRMKTQASKLCTPEKGVNEGMQWEEEGFTWAPRGGTKLCSRPARHQHCVWAEALEINRNGN